MLKSIFRPILWVIMLPIKIIMLPFTLAGAIQKVMIGVFLLVIIAAIVIIVLLVGSME